MTYLYHFHATRQLSPGQIQNTEGVLECGRMIDTTESFASARAEINRMSGIASGETGLVINSLTLLNPH